MLFWDLLYAISNGEQNWKFLLLLLIFLNHRLYTLQPLFCSKLHNLCRRRLLYLGSCPPHTASVPREWAVFHLFLLSSTSWLGIWLVKYWICKWKWMLICWNLFVCGGEKDSWFTVHLSFLIFAFQKVSNLFQVKELIFKWSHKSLNVIESRWMSGSKGKSYLICDLVLQHCQKKKTMCTLSWSSAILAFLQTITISISLEMH